MKSAVSAIQGFDLVLVSRVVCIIQIVTICQLRGPNPHCLKKVLFFVDLTLIHVRKHINLFMRYFLSRIFKLEIDLIVFKLICIFIGSFCPFEREFSTLKMHLSNFTNVFFENFCLLFFFFCNLHPDE